MTLAEKIGQELRDRRRERQTSTTKLEELSGITNSYISKIENGKHAASLTQMERLLLPLGCTLKVVEIRKPREYWQALASGETQPEDLIDEHFIECWRETHEGQNMVRDRLISRFTVGHYFND